MKILEDTRARKEVLELENCFGPSGKWKIRDGEAPPPDLPFEFQDSFSKSQAFKNRRPLLSDSGSANAIQVPRNSER
jgi:hypothetical protein